MLSENEGFTVLRACPTHHGPTGTAQLWILSGSEKPDLALLIWTLKEAHVKARGLGLFLPLNSFSVRCGGMEGIRLEPGPVEATSQRAEGWGSWILPDTALHSCSNASEPASSTLGNAIIVRPT